MKIKKINKNQKGMTLIEITLVIAILLGLISVLFIGITAYKRGSDNAKCVLQLATLQKLAISYGNLNALPAGAACTATNLTAQDFITTIPDCPDPTASAYNGLTNVPIDDSEAYAVCTIRDAGPPEKHMLSNTGATAAAGP